VFPGQPGDMVPPAVKLLPEKVSRRHPEQMPEAHQLAPLNVEEQRLYSELLPNVTELLTL